MNHQKKKRVVEFWTGVEWAQAKMKDLKTGDLFRMFEPDGERVTNGPVPDAEGYSMWYVTDSPRQRDDEVWEVTV